MLRNRSLTLGLALGVAAMAAAAGVQSINPVYTPKVGDVTEYSVKGTIEAMGVEVGMMGTDVQKVMKVEDDKYIEQSTATIKISIQGQEQEMPAQVTTTTYAKNGQILEIEGSESANYRGANLAQFVRPGKDIKVGDSWTHEAKADAKNDFPAYKITYKYVGDEKVGEWDCAKFEVKAGETEGEPKSTAESILWLDKTEWKTIKAESKFKNMIAAGAPGPMDGSTVVVRTK